MENSMSDYMKEFNNKFLHYKKSQNEDNEMSLSRSLTILLNANVQQEYDLYTLETKNFFVNLHQALEKSNGKSEFFWSCILIIDQASSNLNARISIVDEYQFIPLLSRCLEKVEKREQIIKILSLLKNLTYGIRITWSEPYLDDFITKLTNFLNESKLNTEDQLVFLSLSVLVNVCYKNTPCINILIKTINVTEFCKKIKSFGVLACKMFYILEYNNGQNVIHQDLQYSNQLLFKEISNTLTDWDVPHLKQILNFVRDIYEQHYHQNNEVDNMSLKEYISDLLKSIENRSSMDDNTANEIQSTYMTTIFEFLNAILKFDNSMVQLYSEIVKLAIKWTQSELASPAAISVLTNIGLEVIAESSKFTDEFEELIPKLVDIFMTSSNKSQQISIGKFLSVFIKNSKMQSIILESMEEESFKSIFQKLENIDVENFRLNSSKLSDEDILFYLVCLQTLAEFSTVAPRIWFGLIIQIFKIRQVHCLIAEGLLRENQELCQYVFYLAKVHEFPSNEISLIVSQRSLRVALQENVSQQQEKYPPFSICKAQCQKIDELFSRINDNIITDKNVVSSDVCDLVELYKHRVNFNASTEEHLQHKLQFANVEIKNLSHQNALLKSEISTLQNMNLSLQLRQGKLQEENQRYQKSIEKSDITITKFNAKFNKEVLRHQNEIKQEQKQYKMMEVAHKNELEQLKLKQKELASFVDDLQAELKRQSGKIKVQEKALADKENHNKQTQRIIDDMTKENLKKDNLIKHLEGKIGEYTENIESLESELKETEQLKQTIVNLMQFKDKSSKRKK